MPKTKEERQDWIRDKQVKVQFARELKEIYESPAFKKVLEGMAIKRLEYLNVIDDLKSSEEDVKSARIQRNTIDWFIRSMILTFNEGDRAAEELARYEEFERQKQGVVGENN